MSAISNIVFQLQVEFPKLNISSAVIDIALCLSRKSILLRCARPLQNTARIGVFTDACHLKKDMFF